MDNHSAGLAFKDVQIEFDHQRKAMRLVGALDNESSDGWAWAEFRLTLYPIVGCVEQRESATCAATTYSVRIVGIPQHETRRVDNAVAYVGGWNLPTGDFGVSAQFVDGKSQSTLDAELAVEEERLNEVQREKEMSERQKAMAEKSARLAAERKRYLASLPKLSAPGAASTPVGSDQKCLTQTLDALKMEGIEKRKRIAELISFGCVSMVPSGSPVTIRTEDAGMALITIESGSAAGRTGWVLRHWIQQAKPTAKMVTN